MMQSATREALLTVAPASKKNWRYWPLNHENHNVVLTWVVVAVMSFAENIWTGTVMVAYIKRLMGGSNTYVGIVEAAQGMSELIVAFPVGYLADKYSKAKCVLVGGLLTPFAVAATAFAVIYGTDHPEHNKPCVYMLIGAMCLWGVVAAISSGPLQALYADSVAEGKRSDYFGKLFIIYLLASVFGPLLSIVLFGVYGNTWSLADLRDIIVVGLALELGVGLGMMFARDDSSLEEPEATAQPAAEESGSTAEQSGSTAAVAAAEDGTVGAAATVAAEAAGVDDADDADADGCGARYRWLIPYLTFASSLLFALGSGMTVKFFPLFFQEDCAMSPIAVQIIYVLVPLVMAPFTAIGTRLGRRVGRVPTMIGLKVVGVALLVTMAQLRDWVREAAGTEDDRVADAHDDAIGDVLGDVLGDVAPLTSPFDAHFNAPRTTERGSGGGGGGKQADYYVALVVIACIYLTRTGLMNCTCAELASSHPSSPPLL